MNKEVLHQICGELMIKYGYLTARDLNKFLNTRKGTALLKHRISEIEDVEYIHFIAKFIDLGLYI